MRLLVTGGAGYIGGFTTRLLSRGGHQVTVLDNLSTGSSGVVGEAELVIGDFADRELVGRVLDERAIEAVFHFAGLKSVAESWREPQRYHEVNVEGTAALLEAMRAAGVTLFVYSGTCAVYGLPDRLPVDETQPVSPLNPYGQSKLMAEVLIRDACDRWGLRYCTLRYFNAAGAELDGSIGEGIEHATNLLPLVMSAAAGSLSHVSIYGTDYPTEDGTAIRDYIHVLDLATAHLRALEYLVAGGEPVTVNVGTGVGTSVRQVIRAAEEVVGRPIPVVDEARRVGDPPAIWADATRAGELLGWRAAYGIADILRSAWSWHRRIESRRG